MVTLHKFSVLIIFHNEERTLNETLKDVFAMDYPRNLLEVICVDDGSTDHSAAIAKRYPVKLIQQKRRWLSASYNAGLSFCTGDYILKLDAHMYIKDVNTLRLINELFSKDNRIAGVCGTYLSLHGADRNFVRDIRRQSVFRKSNKQLTITLNNFTTWSSAIGAYRKEVFEQVRFPEEFTNSYGEDVWVQIQLHNQGYKFIYSPNIVGIHDASIDNGTLLKKMEYEITATGNILLAANNLRIPFLNYFLSYPLLLLIASLSVWFLPFYGMVLVILLLGIELYPSLSVFSLSQYSMRKRISAWCYLLGKECIQAVYLPFYLLRHLRSAKQALGILGILLQWEREKIRRVFMI